METPTYPTPPRDRQIAIRETDPAAATDTDERFRIMADSSPLMIWVTDATGHVEFVNRAYCDFFGKRANGSCAREWELLLHPDDAAAYIAAFDQSLRERAPFRAEARVHRADGEWRWITSYATPRFSADGTFLGMTGSSPDVTDTIVAGQQLRISEARYRTLVEAAPAHIVHCDAEGALTWVSPSLLAFTGMTEAELLGDLWKIAPAVHPADRTPLVEAFEQSLNTKTRMELEVRLRARDGGHRWHLASISPVIRDDGIPAEWIGVATDIHAVKEAEEKLRASEQHFRVALHASPIVVFTTDRDLRFSWIYNPMGGIPADRIVGRSIAEIVGEIPGAPLVRFAREILATGSSNRDRIEFPASDLGVWDLWGEPMHDEEGVITGMIAAGMNVTELTHALRDAEDANRMRDRFLGMISHELRTPMTSIVGWTSLLATGSVDDETMPLVLRSLQTSCRMLQKLVDDLLDLTRLMNDRMALHLRPVALSDVVRDAVAAILPSANQKGLTVRASLPSDPVVVEADSQRLHQIVANLLSNAVKFTDSGGSIDVALVTLESRTELSVTDTGKGISPDFLPFVFDRFSQEEKGGGLGLGLSIVRELVERHGGIISAHSEGPGRGATFIVRLPCEARQP